MQGLFNQNRGPQFTQQPGVNAPMDFSVNQGPLGFSQAGMPNVGDGMSAYGPYAGGYQFPNVPMDFQSGALPLDVGYATIPDFTMGGVYGPGTGNAGQGTGVGRGEGRGNTGTAAASSAYAGGFSGGSASRGVGGLRYKQLLEGVKST